MAVISMKQLLEAGVHFGHQTRKWNPKMKKYIYAARNDIHIIDLQITVGLIEQAYKFVAETTKAGKTILFVGTKKQAQEAIKQEAERCEMFYINSRWLGGTLTNFKTIKSRIDRLNTLEQMEKMGDFDILPKKEVIKLKHEMDKLLTNIGGIRDLRGVPGAMFVVDPNKEDIAIKEARKLGIPVVAITDTNCDPDLVDYVIPGNDDAIRAVKLLSSVIADAVIEARQGKDGFIIERSVDTRSEVQEDVQELEEQTTIEGVEVAKVELQPEVKEEPKEEETVSEGQISIEEQE